MTRTRRITCPDCGLPYDIPTDEGIERWSCDCGAAWRLDE